VKAPLLVLAVAAVAAGACLAGPVPFAAAVLACQGLLVAGWSAAGLLPSGRSGAAVALGAGAAADALLLPGGTGSSLGPLLAVVAGAVAAALTAHLRVVRRAGREGSASSLALTVTVSVLAVLMSALVVERGVASGPEATVAVLLAAGAATAVLVSHLFPQAAAAPGALAAALGVGFAAGRLAADLGVAPAVALCGTAGVASLVAREVVRCTTPVLVGAGARPGRAAQRVALKEQRRQGKAALLLGGTLPLVLAAPATYVLGRLLAG
jgi:hypothetical protein